LPGGPVGPLSGWAATSNVEVGQTVYPADRATGGRGGKEERGRESQRGGEGRKELKGGKGP